MLEQKIIVTKDKVKNLGNAIRTKLYTDKKYKLDEMPNAIQSIFSFQPELVSWSTGTDDEIIAMLKAYYKGEFSLEDIQTVWHIGDKREITINAIPKDQYVGESHQEQKIELQILDFAHDELIAPINNKTKALITIDQKDCLMDAVNYENMKSVPEGELMPVTAKPENGYINSTQDNTTRWANCSRRKWLNDSYLKALPLYLQNSIKEVKKPADNSYTIDKVFFLSEQEILGLIKNSAYAEGEQYPIYQDINNRIKRPRWRATIDSNNNIWWSRSPYKSGNVYWCEIKEDMVSDMHYASRAYGIAPAMCL
jgi:hypothetical protein